MGNHEINDSISSKDVGQLLGEIITWTVKPSRQLSLLDLKAALGAAGLDQDVARDLLPRNAFARAARQMAERRIIRRIGEAEAEILFQFTAEQMEIDRFAYAIETVLVLDKVTGEIRVATDGRGGMATADEEALRARAQVLTESCLATRTASDITTIVQRLFKQSRTADLFPLRPAGGVYFVAAAHQQFVDQVADFVRRTGGAVNRFPVARGTPDGDAAVRDAVTAGLNALIRDHEAAVDGFDLDTRDGTLARAAERLKRIRHKVESYAEYLAEQKAALDQHLAAAKQRLRQRVISLQHAQEQAGQPESVLA